MESPKFIELCQCGSRLVRMYFLSPSFKIKHPKAIAIYLDYTRKTKKQIGQQGVGECESFYKANDTIRRPNAPMELKGQLWVFWAGGRIEAMCVSQ